MGIVLIPLPLYFTVDSIIEGVRWGLILLGVIVIPLTVFSFFLIAIGLMTTTTEIDLASRTVRITRRNIRGAQGISEASIDDICINAQRMGRTTAASRGSWIVRAGFMFEGENGEDTSVAIWSREIADENNIKERNEIMFELYRFFFPDRPAVNEGNIITNGSVVMLLPDKEIEEFKQRAQEPALFEVQPLQKENTGE